MSSINVWCDGGVIGKNPSKHGGTWAFITSQGNHWSGTVSPRDYDLPVITNNFMELYAALQAINYAVGFIDVEWRGTLYTDSQITIYRLSESTRFANIPQWMRLRALDLRRFRKWKIVLVKGHPSKKDLARGKTLKGVLVHPNNVWCDEECQRLAREFQREQGK